MTAKRYSGTVSALVTYIDAKCHYRVYLDHPTRGIRKGHTVIVGEPKVLTRAVDSSEAFDDVFRAAISFAGDEFYEQCSVDDNGRVIACRSLAECGRTLMDRGDTVHSAKSMKALDELIATSPAFEGIRETK